VARFDQVEGVPDADRDKAWRRIRGAARKFGVEIEARGWRDLFQGDKARKNWYTSRGDDRGRRHTAQLPFRE